ncbi:MAG TPA: hypothetical protein PKO09_14605 [Anaerolineae bacterium]|nr:hypothetical protein [Anaerolineae bacterium]
MLILVLFVAWLVLMILTFRGSGTPAISRFLFFLCFLVATGLLAFQFAVKVLKWNPNPLRVDLAHRLMEDKFIDLAQVAPGVYDLDYIHLIDADVAATPVADTAVPADPSGQEWLVFYQYDVVDPHAETVTGPFGAAIYGQVNCRPPSILSYELSSTAGGPLGEDEVDVAVENIVTYADPLSAAAGLPLDRPEVIIKGFARGAVTDLNIFRKVGVQLNCLQQRQWRAAHPGEAFPNSIRYENIGSFHASYLIRRDKDTITTLDRDGMERSQIATQRVYAPQAGSYFRPGTQVLLDPAEKGLVFGPGQPQDVTQVHYPEKAVLAFYLALGKDGEKLATARQYLSAPAQESYDIASDTFGLALARSELERVLVWEIGYVPDIQAEQLRQPRPVHVSVAGVNSQGAADTNNVCRVTWRVIGVPNDEALPYGCEWRLDSYESTCAP